MDEVTLQGNKIDYQDFESYPELDNPIYVSAKAHQRYLDFWESFNQAAEEC